ncbi:hypothetical protein B0H19DRAFT_663809 [Mycena capillaripes]|nr:hypothetical protein B0H19DRAFT_663809 [Mycena capillaripes]
MPVLTRNMRKTACLPDLPPHFPADVPPLVARPPSNRPSRLKVSHPAVPRSTLRIASPVVLSSPARFDAASPLTPSSSQSQSQSQLESSSQNSRASSYSTATQFDDDAPLFSEVHPGVRKLQRKPDPGAKWNLHEDGESVRMRMDVCAPPLVDPRRSRVGEQFGKEWGMLSEQTQTGKGSRASSASVSSDATVVSSSGKAPNFLNSGRGQPPHVSRRNGVAKR